MTPMRRRDRQVTDLARIKEILAGCDCCRIGFADGDGAYILPLNFGCRWAGELPVLYFHCAQSGRKLDLMGHGTRVGFEMDTGHRLFYDGDPAVACNAGMLFRSIVGKGTLTPVESDEEKLLGLNLLMEHQTGKAGWRFDPQELAHVAVLRLVVTEMSCKERKG